MRAKTPKILTLLLALTAPAAFARPRHHVAAKPAHTSPARARTAKAPAHRPTRAQRKAAAHAVSRDARRTPQPRVAHTPPQPDLPPIHVTHDRKHHLALNPPPAIQPLRWHPRTPDQPDLILPVLTFRGGRVVLPAALKGSHEILVHQNEMADQDGLTRIQDDDDLLAARSRGTLVPIPVSPGLLVDSRLPFNRRYTRPSTAAFLETLARAHYATFRTPLQVNSAVRTVAFQQHLLHTNGNAAPAEGETASPHLTGQAVDLAKHGLSLTEIAWLRAYLLPLTQQGKIDVEEEFRQSCFHVSVYRSYLPVPAQHRVTIPVRSTAATLAAAIPSVAPAP